MGWLRSVRNIAVAAKPLLTEAQSFLASLEDGRFDYEVPRTAISSAAQRLGGAVTQANLLSVEPLLKPLLVGFCRWMSRPATLARLRRDIRNERGAVVDMAAEAAASLVAPASSSEESFLPGDAARFKEACAYLDQMHQQLPYAPFALIPKMPIWTPDFLWDVLRLVHLRQQVRAKKGEAKGYALEALARHLTEYIHQRYLKTLDLAELLVSGKDAPKKQPSYGGLVKNLGAAAGLQGLVMADAAMVRNAASHLERWRLDFAAEKVTIEDGSGQLKRRDYTFDELEALCDQLLGDVVAFGTALVHHMGERIGDLVLDTQLPELVLGALSENPVDAEVVEKERQRMNAQLAPLRARWAELFPSEVATATLPVKSTCP